MSKEKDLHVAYELCVSENPKNVIEDHDDASNNDYEKGNDMFYKIDDVPPWYLCILFGLQHFLTVFGGILTLSLLVGRFACLKENDPQYGYFLSTGFFVCGISTLLQTAIGARLPLVQAYSGLFLGPTFAFLSLPQFKCMDNTIVGNSTLVNQSEDWTIRIRELQGAYMVASLVEIFLGLTGFIGVLIRFISPITITSIVCLLAIGIFSHAITLAEGNWPISLLVTTLMILFTQYLKKIPLYYISGLRKPKLKQIAIPVFQLLPVILSISIAWFVCCLLTVTNLVDESSEVRVDKRLSSLTNTHWFRVPYPGQWGWPRVSVSLTLGFSLGVIASALQSIGDYHSCCELVGAPQIPKHAINRGIMIEGIGTFLCGLFGTSVGLTSYTSDIANIRATKIGSKVVVQYCGAILIIFGVIAKVGSFFSMIPSPILGGQLMFFFPLILGVGLSNLSVVRLNSRNTFILGISLFFGISIPEWIQKQKGGAFRTGYPQLDQILSFLLTIQLFVGSVVSVFFDNTIPGSLEERGITQWRKSRGDKLRSNKCYGFPVISKWIKRHPWLSQLPISPSYQD